MYAAPTRREVCIQKKGGGSCCWRVCVYQGIVVEEGGVHWP